MSYRSPGTESVTRNDGTREGAPSREEILLASHVIGDGLCRTALSVPAIHCGGCIRAIEQALGRIDGVVEARVNLTARRVAIRWRADAGPPPFVETLAELGYRPHLDEPDPAGSDSDAGGADPGSGGRRLCRRQHHAALGVGVVRRRAGTRSLFHWLSALIALPALAYSGRVFYRSAWAALRHGRTSMDVPISIGVALAFGMSLYDTIRHGQDAYFDASVMLLFFLLIGRTLDHLMREKARTAIKGLARARGSGRHGGAGRRHTGLSAGRRDRARHDRAAGGRRAGPGRCAVQSGASDLDCSLVTGESAPRSRPAGCLDRGRHAQSHRPAPAGGHGRRRGFVPGGDGPPHGRRESRPHDISAPRRSGRPALFPGRAHLGLLGFLGWLAMTGDVHRAATIAVAVLIITCPCALGLAVPIVQVVAARRLFEHGVMIKDGVGLERLAEIDTVVLDKTGTLTLGWPSLREPDHFAPPDLALAAALAGHSRHPYSRALVAAHGAQGGSVPRIGSVREHPGYGLEALAGTDVIRLGRPDWALDGPEAIADLPDRPHTTLARNGRLVAAFAFHDPVRPAAREAVAALRRQGLAVEVLSGDHREAVERLARELGIGQLGSGVLPRDKVARLAALSAAGHKVLMVGDGLNDAPALAAAHVSMAPSSAADVGRNAADLVFLRESLEAVPLALAVARRAARLIRQNLALAVLYNAIALPFAIAGLVTPLLAALAMSSSSILVVANALRLNGRLRPGRGLSRQGATDLRPLAPAMQATE